MNEDGMVVLALVAVGIGMIDSYGARRPLWHAAVLVLLFTIVLIGAAIYKQVEAL